MEHNSFLIDNGENIIKDKSLKRFSVASKSSSNKEKTKNQLEHSFEKLIYEITKDLFQNTHDKWNFTELYNFMRMKKLDCSEKDLITIFNHLDKDCDGFINVDQLGTLVEPYLKTKQL